jgi:hypothetical protein
VFTAPRGPVFSLWRDRRDERRKKNWKSHKNWPCENNNITRAHTCSGGSERSERMMSTEYLHFFTAAAAAAKYWFSFSRARFLCNFYGLRRNLQIFICKSEGLEINSCDGRWKLLLTIVFQFGMQNNVGKIQLINKWRNLIRAWNVTNDWNTPGI